MMFQAFMQCMVMHGDYTVQLHNLFCICIVLSPNRLESSDFCKHYCITFKELCTVGFSKLGAQQQEKPVEQIQLTKIIVLVNTTELDGESCTCAAYIRHKLHCYTVGTSNKNKRWRSTTTESSCWTRSQANMEPHNHLQKVEQKQSHIFSHLFACLHPNTQSGDHCGTVCHSQGQTLATPVEYVLYQQLEWTTDTSYEKKFNVKINCCESFRCCLWFANI